MLRQRCAVAVLAISHRVLVRVVPLLKGLRRQPGVVLFIIRRCHGRLIHYRLYLALAVQRAVVLHAAVARLSTCEFLAFGLPVFKDGAVMLPDHS